MLGRGGMGTVFLANHLRLPGRQVAIKVLRNDGGLGKEVYVRFRREAEIASRLGHPNIVEVLDFDNLPDGSPYMVMECLRGLPLSRRMRKGPLTLEEVFSVARQMGSALQAAHRAGVVHRDLKPGNVFLSPTEVGGVVMEHVKLLDFGISKILDSHSVNTQGGILLGTPQYMAPEQALGKNQDVDPRTDIFSFGCMVYEMLARKLPFKDGNLPELIYRIVYDPPQPLEALAPGVPEQVVDAVERALQKRPDDRFPDVGSFIEALTGSPLQTLSSYSVTAPVAALPVRPSQAETVGPKRPGAESPMSKPPTVDGRRPAPVSSPSAGSARRPVLNVALDEVPTATMGPPGAEEPAPEAVPADARPAAAEAPSALPPTQVLRGKGSVALGPAPAPVLVKPRSTARWVAVVAAVLVVAGAVALVVGPRLGAMQGTQPPVVKQEPSTAPSSQGGVAGDGAGPASPSQVVGDGTKPASPAEGSVADEGAHAAPTALVAKDKPSRPGTVPVPDVLQPAEPPPPTFGLAPTPSPEQANARTPESPPGAEAAHKGPRSARPAGPKGPPTTIPEAALADLSAAEKALERGDLDEALHLVRRSQRVQVTGTSFSILTRAYCRQRDLSNARTSWERVPAWERVRVRGYCKQYDIAL
ncbi:serine/threonine-protein kinase [Pyxidicoccus xibeiensis]|uniref:serine/threonine-protein kinase n=1 Tax=Pyxidicoccus xibeiensis TaxID=2906759 RepID=UPI0020A7B497|nr:protein kinase [Pyxidicoccus xibeiensis]